MSESVDVSLQEDGVSSDATGTPSVGVVIVTYNSAAVVGDLLRLLPAAMGGTGTPDVVVVDNASSDETTQLVRGTMATARVLDMGRNAGYAAAINRGVACLKSVTHVLVLNPDARPVPGAVGEMLRLLQRCPDTGIVVPRIVDGSGSLKYSLRREPTIMRALGEALLGGHRAARWARFGEEIRDPLLYTDARTTDWATGAAMLLSGPCLSDVGLWDESFFLYSEETDYALRARDAGYLTRYCHSAVVGHEGGDMERSRFLWSLVARNRVRLYRKRHGRLVAGVFWSVVLVNELSRAAMGRRTSLEAARVLLGWSPRL